VIAFVYHKPIASPLF